ncbi:ribonuclease H-like domain-containing protein [Tanacetum coccineum]|uniref:Ribonuclease H-like domain-containing protein n=1 Tax=Tanacetum coccineum TaxID=301880 RepID=A0ABQ4ZSB3_9ASTR
MGEARSYPKGPEVEVDLPLAEILRESLSITNFEGHGLVIVPKGHLFTVNIDQGTCRPQKVLPKIRRTRGSATDKNQVCLLCEVILKQIPAFNFICASLESISAIENTWEWVEVWEDIPTLYLGFVWAGKMEFGEVGSFGPLKLYNFIANFARSIPWCRELDEERGRYGAGSPDGAMRAIEGSIVWICLLIVLAYFHEGTPCITDCVMAELEKLGQKYRVALRCVVGCLVRMDNLMMDYLYEHYVIGMLWEILKNFSLEDRHKFLKGKRCEKNYSSVRRYVADPDNAYPKRSITKLILKGAVIFDVVSYQFRCALNYSKLLLKLLNQEYVARIRGKLIQKLLLNQKCMGYLVRAYYSISLTKYYKDDSCWSADLKSNTTEDVISI